MSADSGRLERVAPGVRRLLAPNASLMTGPGTNTYLLGDPIVAVIDPGPDDPHHVAAIRAAAPQLQTIYVTHTHRDHSPAATALRDSTRALVVGLAPPRDGRQDPGFVADRAPVRDEVFRLQDRGLRAIDTPGHASNHVCYLLEPDGLLFSGDHVLDGVTPVILAPDGSMVDYLQSLSRLLDYPLRAIAPGHGSVLREPRRVIEAVVAHRLAREQKVVTRLREMGTSSIESLLVRVYDDVSAALHPYARLTLEAHLIKLLAESRVHRDGDRWRVA